MRFPLFLTLSLAVLGCDPAPDPRATGPGSSSAAVPDLPSAEPGAAVPGSPSGDKRAAAPAAPTREVPVFHQVGAGCIPYSAAAVAHYHGAPVDPLDLLRSVPVTKAGVAYTDVAAELAKRGLRAEIIHPSVGELRGLLARGLPVVVGQTRSVKADHALVAIRHDPARAVYAVMDPAQPGLREKPAADLESAFEATGRQALLVRPAAPAP